METISLDLFAIIVIGITIIIFQIAINIKCNQIHKQTMRDINADFDMWLRKFRGIGYQDILSTKSPDPSELSDEAINILNKE